MRIILGSESYYPNVDGGAVAERQLALRMAGLGHTVAVIAPSFKGMVNYTEADGQTVIYRPSAVTVPMMKEYRVTIRPGKFVDSIVRQFKPEIVHIHNPYPIGYALLRSARKARIPCIGSNHLMPENFFMTIRHLNFLYKPLRTAGWRFITRFYNRFDAVISPSLTAIKLLQDNGLKRPAHPVSNGVDLSRFKPGLDGAYLRKIFGIPSEIPVVLYTGRLGGEKSLDVLLKAFALASRRIKASLVFTGTGPDADTLKTMARDLGIMDSTHFVGFVPDRDFPFLYSIGDLFASPSTAELQSIVTLEAMGSGLPVVAADSHALPELVHENRNGFLFKPFDHEAMADRLVALLSKPALRRRMGIESRTIVERHDYPKVIKIFEKLYQEVIKSYSGKV